MTKHRSLYTQEIIKLLMAVKEGATITYDALSIAAGIDIRPNRAGYPYQKNARSLLEKEENIVFEVISKTGLRRMLHEEVAKGTLYKHVKEKRAMIKRNIIRIGTVANSFNQLSAEGKLKTTVARTLLAFDDEITKPESVLKLEKNTPSNHMLIGFNNTLKLFKK